MSSPIIEIGKIPSSRFDCKLKDSKAFIKTVKVAAPSNCEKTFFWQKLLLAKIIFVVDAYCLLVEFVFGQNSVGNPGSDAYSSLEKMFVSDSKQTILNIVCVELSKLKNKLGGISKNN